jgi:hypothetical protein
MMLGLSFANSKQALCCFLRFAALPKLPLPLSVPVAVDAAAAVVGWDWTVDTVSTFALPAGVGAPGALGSGAACFGACAFSAIGCTSCASEFLSPTPCWRREPTAQPPITATATSTMGIQRCRLSQSSLPEYMPFMFPFHCLLDFSVDCCGDFHQDFHFQ